jgi:hypothetical protein
MTLDIKIKAKIESSLADTKIDQISPDETIEEAIAVQGYQLSTLSDSKLSEYIYTLAQYVSFLQVQCNVREVATNEAKRNYEFAVAKAVTKIEGKTIKERMTQALIESEALQKLEQEYRIAEADLTIFKRVPESISDIGNAFKKELAIRLNNKAPYERH